MDTVTAIATIALVATAALWDFRENRIPNWLTLSAIPVGIAWNTWMGGFAGFQMSLAGFAVGFGILFILFATGGGGGGDVKLMGALGAWVGVQTIITVFLLATGMIFLLLVFSAMMKAISQNAKTGKHTVAFALPVFVATTVLVLAKVCVAAG
ncbi:A24 family peptidase [Thalassoglobus sp.]|uniref:A24 family peptidase n=1 Tax=Thalassoglobus sp. TaxID=2795869 RepID=UPI003AA9A645